MRHCVAMAVGTGAVLERVAVSDRVSIGDAIGRVAVSQSIAGCLALRTCCSLLYCRCSDA
jgi:hypothetical protein